MRIKGLGAVVGNNPKILILGTFPGHASIDEGRYFSDAGNRFWMVMARLLKVDFPADPAARYDILKKYGIALWDMLHDKQYDGTSLDKNLDPKPRDYNDIPGFLDENPTIQHVFFAFTWSKKNKKKFSHVTTLMKDTSISYTFLPSTSGSNRAHYPEDAQIVEEWRVVLEYL